MDTSRHEPSADVWTELAARYDVTRAIPEGGEEEVQRRLVSLLRDLSVTRILEVGAGTGRMALPVARAGIPVVAADRSPQMLVVLREKDPEGAVRAVRCEAMALPFGDGAFDGVLFSHILHLLPDVAAFAETLRPLLRPRAAIVVVDTAYLRRDVTERVLAAVFPRLGQPVALWPADGVRSKDRECLATLLEIVGGEETDVIEVGTYPHPTSLAAELARLRCRDGWSMRRHEPAAVEQAVDGAIVQFVAEGADLDAPADEPWGVRFLVARLRG